MLLRLLFILTLTYKINACFSQSVDFESHSPFQTSIGDQLYDLVGRYNSNYYFLYENSVKRNSMLVEFNSELRPTGKRVLVAHSEQDGYSQEQTLFIRQLDAQVDCINYSSNNSHVKLFLNQFDVSSLDKSKRIELLKSIIDKNSLVWFKSSNDSSKHAFVHTMSYGKNKDLVLKVFLFDDFLRVISEQIYVLPITSTVKFFSGIFKVILLNSGELVLVSTPTSKEENNFSLFKLQNSQVSSEYVIHLERELIGDVKFISNGIKVKIIGLYGKAKDFSVRGIFYHEVSFSEHNSGTNKWNEFNNEFINHHISSSVWVSRDIKLIRKNKTLSKYSIIDALNYGSKVILLAEQYPHQHLFAACLTSDGSIDWIIPIKKDASAVDPQLLQINDNPKKFVFIYSGFNSDLSNKPTEGGISSSAKKMTPKLAMIQVNISFDGHIDKHILADNTKLHEFIILSSPSYWLIGDNLIIYTMNNQFQRFFSMPFPQ